MKFGLCSVAIVALLVATPAFAAKGCDCKGTIGGSAAYGHMGSTNSSASQSGQSTGLQYFNYYVHKSVVDDYQPWPEEEMRKFQKP